MPRVLFGHVGSDPLSTGELRRLALPALALEGGDWTCEFLPAALCGQAGPIDIAVLPLRALGALGRLRDSASVRVVVEVDAHTALSHPGAASVLSSVANRIVGAVARDPRAEAWAGRVLGSAAPVWLAPDLAARPVELAAAALRFGSPFPEIEPPQAEAARELWFCEPGDYIEAEEVTALLEAWAEGGEHRLIVAPQFIRAWLAQSGLRVRSRAWSPAVLREALSETDRCVFLGPETYPQARRRVLALRAGAPAEAPSVALNLFEPAEAAARWGEALLPLARPPRAAPSPARPDPVRMLAFLDLIQDLDPILPILDRLRSNADASLRIVATDWVERRSPRLAAELRARGLSYETCDRQATAQGAAPSLEQVDAVLAVAESNLPAHAPTHALFKRARALGVPTFALQHGVENVGLHHVPGEEDALCAADHLFVWFAAERTPESVGAALRPRLVHVGRSVAARRDLRDIKGVFATFDRIVAVFENLHWRRYDAAWRSRFLSDCADLAFSDPASVVIVKPHHAGLWLVKNQHLMPQWPSNLVIADPTDAFWEPYTAAALVEIANAVITTPSTVALDAAQAGKPVAVAAYGLSLPAYEPLPFLQTSGDWAAFIAQAGSVEDARRRAGFLSKTAVGDDPAGDAAAHLTAAAYERRRMRRARAPAVALWG